MLLVFMDDEMALNLHNALVTALLNRLYHWRVSGELENVGWADGQMWHAQNKLLNAWVWKIIFNCDQGFFFGCGKKKMCCDLYKGFFGKKP